MSDWPEKTPEEILEDLERGMNSVLNPSDILYKRYDETDEEFKTRVKEVYGIED